jgi:hypothetical protein
MRVWQNSLLYSTVPEYLSNGTDYLLGWDSKQKTLAQTSSGM